jgi:hypothetical protein
LRIWQSQALRINTVHVISWKLLDAKQINLRNETLKNLLIDSLNGFSPKSHSVDLITTVIGGSVIYMFSQPLY